MLSFEVDCLIFEIGPPSERGGDVKVLRLAEDRDDGRAGLDQSLNTASGARLKKGRSFWFEPSQPHSM